MNAGAPTPTASRQVRGDAVFGHVLVGIDETPESLVGAAQAGVLRAPDGRLVLMAVAESYLAAQAGLAAADAEEHLLAGVQSDLARARELVEADDAVLVSGRLVDLLCTECVRQGATLVAVGVRRHRRLGALTFGGHEVEALHDAPCSVLIARPGWGPSKPERIVVGVDGSPESREAESVARSLAERLGCEVLPVVALGDGVDPELLRSERGDVLLDPGRLVDAVVDASSKGGLVVVGGTRERGRRWSGSLAERVAYGARGSVLVVRHASDATA